MAGTDVTLISPGLTIQLCVEEKKKERGQTIKNGKERGGQVCSLLEAQPGVQGEHIL